MADRPSLDSIFHDAGRPGAAKFRSAARRAGRNITFREASEFVRKQGESQIFQKPDQKEGKITASERDGSWQVDIIDFSSKDGRKNDWNYYAMICVDVLTRFCYYEPLKTKSPEETKKALEGILERARRPREIATDSGNEWGKAFRDFLEREKIFHRLKEYENSLGVVDATIRTLKQSLAKVVTAETTESWAEPLRRVVDAYNKNSHGSLMESAPADVRRNKVLNYALEKQAGRDIKRNADISDERAEKVRRLGAFRVAVERPARWNDIRNRIDRPSASSEVYPVENIRGGVVESGSTRAPLRSVVAVPLGSRNVNPPESITLSNPGQVKEQRRAMRKFVEPLRQMLRGGRSMNVGTIGNEMKKVPGFSEALRRGPKSAREFVALYPGVFEMSTTGSRYASVKLR